MSSMQRNYWLITSRTGPSIKWKFKKTLSQLQQKHSQGKEVQSDILLTDTPEQVHAIKFDATDADLVKNAAFETRGGAGP